MMSLSNVVLLNMRSRRRLNPDIIQATPSATTIVFLLTCINIRCNVAMCQGRLMYVFTFNVALGSG